MPPTIFDQSRGFAPSRLWPLLRGFCCLAHAFALQGVGSEGLLRFCLFELEKNELFRCQSLLRCRLALTFFCQLNRVMTLEEQYITLMDAAGWVSDEWYREKFIQEADNVLLQINAQILKNRQEFDSMAA